MIWPPERFPPSLVLSSSAGCNANAGNECGLSPASSGEFTKSFVTMIVSAGSQAKLNSKSAVALVTAGIMCCGACNAHAGLGPSFFVDASAWKATHILVVSEGEKLDGRCVVLESWKGDLETNSAVFIPELAAFEAQETREIKRWPNKPEASPSYVSCARMVLFLKRSTLDGSQWEPTGIVKTMNVSMAWVEQGKMFAIVQWINPGPSELVQLAQTEAAFKARVLESVQTQDALAKTEVIRELNTRAEALSPFVTNNLWYARGDAFSRLGKCGEPALPVLRSMLSDTNLLAHHDAVISTLAHAGGMKVGAEILNVLEAEIQFWKQRAPKLEMGWWNGAGLSWPEVEALRNHYTKVGAALAVLRELKYRESKIAVTELRDFWRSLPQLDDRSGINQMIEGCDEMLKEFQEQAP